VRDALAIDFCMGLLCVCVYVDLHVSMGQFVCMAVRSMYIYIHIYTYNICLVHSCHVQV